MVTILIFLERGMHSDSKYICDFIILGCLYTNGFNLIIGCYGF